MMIGMNQKAAGKTTMHSLMRARSKQHLDAAQKILDRAERETRELTASEQSDWDWQLARAEEINKKLAEQDQLRDAMEARMTGEIDPDFESKLEFNQSGSGPYIPGGDVRVVTPKLRTFKGPDAARDAYDSSLWLRGFVLNDGASRAKLESRRPQWMASQNEANPTAGGYTVPPQFHRAIIDYRDEVGATRKLATVLPMGSDNLSVPKLSSGPTVYVVGEESTITDSSSSFERVTLIPRKRACLTYISSELSDDNAVGLLDLTAQRMALALALHEDSCFVTGDGTSTYGGVLGVLDAVTAATAGVVQAATGNDTWPEITFADIAKCMAAVASKYRTNGELAFLCSTAFKWQVLDRLSLAQGGALMQQMTDGVRTDMFAGYPVVTSDYMPTTTAANTICLLFGNFRQSCLMGDRQTLRLAMSEHTAFVTDQIAIRATTRFDINNHEMGDTVTAGGVVALKTAS